MKHTTKTLFVTSALPYANGVFIWGIWWNTFKLISLFGFKNSGHACYYMCADDAHGTAIMLSAEKDGVTPDAYIDAVKAQHMSDFKQFNIDYDHYYSTHSEENRVLSETIYNAANDDGGIIKKDIQQYFDEDKGLFLADRYIKAAVPSVGRLINSGDAREVCYATYSATELVDPVSVLSEKPPVLKESTHYFFDLEKYRDHITDWLATDPVSDPVKNKLNEWLTGELKPLGHFPRCPLLWV